MTTGTPTLDQERDLARFRDRGPVSARLLEALRHPASDADAALAGLSDEVDRATRSGRSILRDDDLQLSLFILHGLHYGSVVNADELWEWQPALVAARLAIEREFEWDLRDRVFESDSHPCRIDELRTAEDVAGALFDLTKPTPGPSLARFIAKQANDEHLREFLVLRSVYTLKEADAQTWTIPRLQGRAKAALVEIQADEYGGGRPGRMHAEMFARTMRELGLDDTYAAYVDRVPAETLASFNMMSMFGLNRRLRGASAGHYAAYEMTSSLPNRMLGDGFRRLGYGEQVTAYFDEHVEADAVHEQIAGRDLAGGLAEDEPHLIRDIMFGALAAMVVDGIWAEETLRRWEAGRSALRAPVNAPGGATGQ